MNELLTECKRLLECYNEHRDSADPQVRRKVHVDLDRWLMDNRELAASCIIEQLSSHKAPKRRWWKIGYKTTGGTVNEYN